MEEVPRDSRNDNNMPNVQDILNMGLGARWLKADLHVHTPASADIADDWTTAGPEDVVRLAIEQGLDLIAVTDHNTAAWCDLVGEAAAKTVLTVLPGVELSTPQGHLLALFDVGTPASHIEDLLVEVGIARKEFGSLEVATKGGIEAVSMAIAEAGGIAIAAHADAERGFLKVVRVGAERRRVYAAENLWALELLDASLRDQYQAGTKSGFKRRMPCLQSSDSWPRGADHHQLDGLAYRFSLLKMGECSLSGLKLALIDPDIRVRLAGDASPSPADSITGMWVTGGFLDGQRFRLNESVNCFIGDTGTGKSLAVELLRFALDQQASVPKIREEVGNLLEQQLGDLGSVHVLLRKGDNSYLVERAWAEPEDPPVVQRVVDGGLEPVDGDLDMQLFFPIKGFSQSEIIEFAREPRVRLSLTDDLIDRTHELAAIKDLKGRLQRNAANITTEREKAANIRSQVGGLSALSESKRQLDRTLKDPRIAEHHRWYKEQNLLEQAEAEIDDLSADLPDSFSSLRRSGLLPDDLSELPNEDLLKELADAYESWEKRVDRTEAALSKANAGLRTQLRKIRDDWDGRFEKAEAAYQTLLAKIDKNGAGFEALSRRRRRVEKQISTLEDRSKELEAKVLPQLEKLEKEREDLLDALQGNRRAITVKREAKAKELTQRLSDTVRLTVRARASNQDFRTALEKLAEGSRLYARELDGLAKIHPVALVKLLLAQDWDALRERSDVEPGKLAKVWDTVVERDRLRGLYDLQLSDVEDVIEVMLRVDNEGTYKPLENLSHGQKCMVVLMVALAEGDFPLLVDQPEDALHAPGIETGIVSTLRSRRGLRQCVFATRNANILVSADAEQIIAMQADSDRGEVALTGALDQFDQRQLVIHHVEGGPEAFRRRQTMYALRPMP